MPGCLLRIPSGARARRICGATSRLPGTNRLRFALHGWQREYLNPYLNYHRPCFFPTTTTDAKGKQRKTYAYTNMMTPYDKLKSLPDASNYLKPGISFETLNQVALQISDNEAADQMKKARHKLFNNIHEQTLKTG